MFYVFYMGWHWTRDRYIQFSCSVMPDSLWPHGLQHARLPCPSRHPRACSNSRPSSRWYQSTIQYFVVPFSSCLPSFPASGSFPVSGFFPSRCQSIGALVLTSVLPMKFRDDFLQHWLTWSPYSPGDSQNSSPEPQFKSINSFDLSLLYGLSLTFTHDNKKKSYHRLYGSLLAKSCLCFLTLCLGWS